MKWWAEVATSAVGAVVEGIVFIVGRAGLVVVGAGPTTSRQVVLTRRCVSRRLKWRPHYGQLPQAGLDLAGLDTRNPVAAWEMGPESPEPKTAERARRGIMAARVNVPTGRTLLGRAAGLLTEQEYPLNSSLTPGRVRRPQR